MVPFWWPCSFACSVVGSWLIFFLAYSPTPTLFLGGVIGVGFDFCAEGLSD